MRNPRAGCDAGLLIAFTLEGVVAVKQKCPGSTTVGGWGGWGCRAGASPSHSPHL